MQAEKSIAAQIVEFIRAEGLALGSHMPAQVLADRLRVSRSPINKALCLLHEKGLLRRERNRGYFLARSVDAPDAALSEELGLHESDLVTRAYFRVADDLLKGLLQTYRLRLALEPAALLEPGYRLDAQMLARCCAAEVHLLDGGIETDSADQLHERGVRFHESLVEASDNPLFIDTIRRVNRVRRMLSYRSMQDRKRYKEHCRQHLRALHLLEKGRNEEAPEELCQHLASTLKNLKKISGILTP